MDQLEAGQLLGYEQMGQLLGLDLAQPRDKQAVLAAARRAADQMRTTRSKVLRPVRGLGYQRAEVGQVIELAHRHQARAAAAVRLGHDTIATIDPNQLDATTAAIVRATAMAFGRQAELMRQLDVRQNRLAEALAAVNATAQTAVSRADQAASQATATQATVEQLVQRLHDLESRVPPAVFQQPGPGGVPPPGIR